MPKIANYVHTLSSGGAEKVASTISMGLGDEYEQYMLLPEGADIVYDYKGTLLNVGKKIRLNKFSRFNLFKRILNFHRTLKKLKTVKKENQLDVVISHLENFNFHNILTAGKVNCKTIITVHSVKSKALKNKRIVQRFKEKALIKILYSKADKIVAVSKGIKSDLINNFGLKEDKIIVIYNAFDVSSIIDTSKEKTENEFIGLFNNQTIVNVASLRYPKGQWHLLRAFQRVIDDFPESNLLIIGKGDYREYLQELASQLNIEKNVHFLGFINNPFKFVSKADLFVFSSLYEGFGMVLLESMIVGTPVISTDCRYGPREILAPNTDFEEVATSIEKHEYGILVPNLDGRLYSAETPLTKEEHALADAMIDTLSSDDLKEKLSRNGKKRAEDFNISSIIKQWEAIINN